MLEALLLFWTAALACEGEPVEIGGKKYTFVEEGGCGNGRNATCETTYRLRAGEACEGPTLTEQFGGGSSRRAAVVHGAAPAERDWLLAKAGFVARTTDRLDGLAQPASDPVRWIAGSPSPPRVSWASIPCPADEELGAQPGDACWDVFRGDQLTFRSKATVGAGVELHWFANDFRNRRTFLVLHDTKRDRHAVLAEVATWGDIPEVVATFDGIWLTSSEAGDAAMLLFHIAPDGRIWRQRFETQVPIGVEAGGVLVRQRDPEGAAPTLVPWTKLNPLRADLQPGIP